VRAAPSISLHRACSTVSVDAPGLAQAVPQQRAIPQSASRKRMKDLAERADDRMNESHVPSYK
jgi:hypothetical protein